MLSNFLGKAGNVWRGFKNLMSGMGDGFFELLAMIEEPDRDLKTGQSLQGRTTYRFTPPAL